MAAEIIFQQVPDAGIQPVLVKDRDGGIHLMYFKEQDGEDKSGVYYYRRFIDYELSWSDAVQVSTRPYYRPHLIARAGMAVDGDGRIHVTWHQDNPVDGYPTVNSQEYLPDILYTRTVADGGSFEPERALVSRHISDTETAAAVAVNGNTVSLVWHGSASEETAGIESDRSVYLILSSDHGTNFSEEALIGDSSLGACGCCGMSASYDRLGNLQVAYRTAVANEGRHMQLLQLSPAAEGKTTLIHPWQLSACPVSTSSMAWDQAGNNHLVFETMGLIQMVNLGTENPLASMVREPDSKLLQKHPAIAVNDRGEKLIVWNEGYGVNGGGTLQWQLFDRAGAPVTAGRKEEIKVTEYSAAAAAALADGSFLILY